MILIVEDINSFIYIYIYIYILIFNNLLIYLILKVKSYNIMYIRDSMNTL